MFGLVLGTAGVETAGAVVELGGGTLHPVGPTDIRGGGGPGTGPRRDAGRPADREGAASSPQYPAIADVDRESSWEVVAPPHAQSEEDGLAGVAFVPAPLPAEAVADVVGEAPTVCVI